MTTTNNCRQSERGNVLFLILIAVALFAALSYVVTQSTRSGGGTTEREQNILSSAQMTQYPTALRTSIIRMILGGVPIENVLFNSPSDFGTLSVNRLVFHPQGGGAVFQAAPSELMAGTANQQGTWNFNANYQVTGIGIDGSGGNELIAFLVGVSAGVCRQANEELGYNLTGCGAGDLTQGVPTSTITVTDLSDTIQAAPAAPADTFPAPAYVPLNIQGQGTCSAIYNRQASGCFYHATAGAGATPAFVFYSVLLER